MRSRSARHGISGSIRLSLRRGAKRVSNGWTQPAGKTIIRRKHKDETAGTNVLWRDAYKACAKLTPMREALACAPSG